MIAKIPFGSTEHSSSRAIFGAAALAAMKPARTQGVFETLLEFGVNHIDTAAGYGDSELHLAPWLRERRDDFFLATKTAERTGAGARAGIERSLERLGVDSIDLIQLHNLVDPADWETAMGPGGALEATLEARDRGLVRFIGVTGHGTRAPEMHLKSLARFDFDSVLVPYNYTMLQNPEYAADFGKLLETCRSRGVAVQTIKAVARRRWSEDSGPRFSWYEPLRDPEAIARAVHFVLRTPDLFLNTSSDGPILRSALEAARLFEAHAAPDPAQPADEALARDVAGLGIEPLFVRGVSDTI